MSIQDKIISVEEFNAMKKVFNGKNSQKKVGESYSGLRLLFRVKD